MNFKKYLKSIFEWSNIWKLSKLVYYQSQGLVQPSVSCFDLWQMLWHCVHLSSPAGVCGVLGVIGEWDVCDDTEHRHWETSGETGGGC